LVRIHLKEVRLNYKIIESKVKTVILPLSILIVLLSCESPTRNDSIKNSENKTDAERYLEGTPDAPLDLYCEVNNALDPYSRVSVCNLLDRGAKVLSADLVIEIEKHQIDTIEVVIFSFDKNGDREVVNINSKLDSVINSIPLTKLTTFKAIKDGTYITRLQLERFCTGYVDFVSLGDDIAKKTIND
jgi:hypothetical protein